MSHVNHPHPKFCCDIIYSLPTKFGVGADFIVTLYFHPPQNFVRGVNISWHYIFTPDKIWSVGGGGGGGGWGDYIVTLHFQSRQNMEWGWLYCDITFSLPVKYGVGVIISWHYICTPHKIWSGGWLYRDIIFSLPAKFEVGGDYIVTLYFHSRQNMERGDYIVTYFHSGQNLEWGWLYRDHIFTPNKIWEWGWSYRDIIFSLPAKYGVGVIISWHYIFTPENVE